MYVFPHLKHTAQPIKILNVLMLKVSRTRAQAAQPLPGSRIFFNLMLALLWELSYIINKGYESLCGESDHNSFHAPY